MNKEESKPKNSGLWTFITAVVVALMVSGTAVFVSIQYNQTQKDIANTQAEAIKDGLSKLGEGICYGNATGYSAFSACKN